MKDSGVEWIGEIPDDWGTKNLKSILAERKENNNPIKTDFILSLTNDRGVIPYTEKGDIGNKSKEDLAGYKLAYPRDIVLNSMNVIIGSVGLSAYFGAVSPVYYMLYLRDTNHSIEYYSHIFQTKVFQESLKGYGNGILAHRMRIPMIKLNTVVLPLPSVIEQKQIANFLDKKVAEIDCLIDKTKLSIDEYGKYRQSLITEIITIGLKETTFKDSKVNYIGKIPSHWEIRRIKNILTPLKRDVLENDDVVTCFRDGVVTLRKNRREEGFTFSEIEHGYQGVEIDDLVIHGLDTFAGAIGVSDSRGKCTPVVHVCSSKESKRFYMYFLRALAFNDVLMAFSDGIRIRSSDFRNWNKLSKIIAVVPPIEEQQQIANFLDKKCNEIDTLISQKEHLLTELESYKKSLIFECVTGKREVI